jgi:outer membrane biosynthesis protein TonB
MSWRSICLLVLVAMGTACRHVPKEETAGSSAFAFVEQPVGPPAKSDGKEVELVERAQYREAQLQEPAALPVYPKQARKAGALLTTIGVRITVDTQGRVSDVRPSILVFNTPGPFVDDFREAVETAVRQWQFRPGRVEYYEIVSKDGFTYTRVTRMEDIESEFDLSFTFDPTGKVKAGK